MIEIQPALQEQESEFGTEQSADESDAVEIKCHGFRTRGTPPERDANDDADDGTDMIEWQRHGFLNCCRLW
jgi:hypothetical protein